MDRKRILFVEQNTDGTVGGSHHSLLLLVKHLDRRLFEPIVAFYESHALVEEYRKYARVVILKDYPPFRFPWASRAGPVAALEPAFRKALNLSLTTAGACHRMAHVFIGLRPDLIHLNNSIETGPSWPVVAALTRTPIVVHQRGFGLPFWYVRGFDRVICVSQAIQEDFVRRVPELAHRSVQIYNGIEIDEFVRAARQSDPAATRAALGIGTDEHLIGLVGNIQTWKGQDVLIRALPLMKSDRPWRCLLIGGTPEVDEHLRYHRGLVDAVRARGLGDRVIFTGYRADIAALINALDVLVHTSIAPEPLGRVLLEGMTLEKPVVATNHGGPKEIIEHEISGYLLPPGDPAALAQCLDRLFASRELRAEIGRAARARIAATFGVAKYVAQVEEVYRVLLAGEPADPSSLAKETL